MLIHVGTVTTVTNVILMTISRATAVESKAAVVLNQLHGQGTNHRNSSGFMCVVA